MAWGPPDCPSWFRLSLDDAARQPRAAPMKRNLLRALGAFAFCSAAFVMPAQTAPTSYAFPPADLMNLGVYYYPEAWPAAQWPRDMANIRKLGMEFVHMGEFSWAFMEPTEGSRSYSARPRPRRPSGSRRRTPRC